MSQYNFTMTSVGKAATTSYLYDVNYERISSRKSSAEWGNSALQAPHEGAAKLGGLIS